ncbi:MAG: ABC-2 transporter permease [Oscillospiraceae bacterium]|nr:ABC-2 transporter permease [Oscillospiraceae bacterium]
MKHLLVKECKLAASPLSYLFLAFALMTLIPGYPILMGSFFICFGLFHSLQSARENNDLLFTILLPVSKAEVVKAKFAFAVLIQLSAFLLCLLLTLLRVTLLKGAGVYTGNAMMNANQAFLAYQLLIFALCNRLLYTGFFRTGYGFTRPFLAFGIAAFAVIAVTEALHHVPGLAWLNATDTMHDGAQWLILAMGLLVYLLVTFCACRRAVRLFEKVDL